MLKGLSIQWEGALDKPVPSDAGWALTARGAGTWGTQYDAVWTSWTAANILTAAIGRGLRWVQGSVGGGYLGQISDSGSLTVTDFLNQYTSPGSLTWRVHRTTAGLQVDVIPVPATVTRILVTNVAAVRTLAGYVNALNIRYQATADKGGAAATYGMTSVTQPASIAAHGRTENYWDLSSAGVMSAGTAQGYGNAALAKYTAASWAAAFQVSPGQYLNAGGAPVDLACEKAGEVVRVILADGPYGGEYNPAPPVIFPVGQIAYNAIGGTAQITPFQAWTDNFATLLTLIKPILA